MYTRIYLKKAGISKNFWNKIMQLFRTVVNYLLNYKKSVEHGIEHDVFIVLMELAYIRNSCRLYNRFDKYLEI